MKTNDIVQLISEISQDRHYTYLYKNLGMVYQSPQLDKKRIYEEIDDIYKMKTINLNGGQPVNFEVLTYAELEYPEDKELQEKIKEIKNKIYIGFVARTAIYNEIVLENEFLSQERFNLLDKNPRYADNNKLKPWEK